MPIIHAHILEGRSEAAKADFARAVTQAAVDHLDVTHQQVRVLVHETPPAAWFVGGEARAPLK